MKKAIAAFLLLHQLLINEVLSQSVAREWNEVVLEAIRNDEARPTVHARNLFHISAAMYDAWAVYDNLASPYFLGQIHRGFYIGFDGVNIPRELNKQNAQEIALSYAAYRVLVHRFSKSPGYEALKDVSQRLMSKLNLDIHYHETSNYQSNPADLGNYIAQQIIEFGLSDGSNEADQYKNRFYEPINYSLFPDSEGSGEISDPNRWQPLSFEKFVGQSGIDQGAATPEFIGPEWGQVVPFALKQKNLDIIDREGHEYYIYYDPGDPAYLDLRYSKVNEQDYQWGFRMVAQWSSHLDPADCVKWDISPASIGNINFVDFPKSISELPEFYDFEKGGDNGKGHAFNPRTNLPYEPQIVPRADYARVLAEFWADGPDSETPPGHWYVILNYVNDHPSFERKYKGQGIKIDPLEWNIKSYFVLGGAMHDAAVTAWGIKGYYDYIRPISAIRWMAEQGQSSDPNLPRYNPLGLPLISDQIELIKSNDPIDLFNNYKNEIKIKAWHLPNPLAENPNEHVGWVLGTRWRPYQRPSFVTPPFAGYISGHSTFSRAAAEVLTLLTGDNYFPGGLGEFKAEKNKFLVFEKGPSTDIALQWATYQDASDQCSLSRIWGGIHPPVDDIPGRKIGYQVGRQAFAFANKYFSGNVISDNESETNQRIIYGPNPVSSTNNSILSIEVVRPDDLHKRIRLIDGFGRLIYLQEYDYIQHIEIDMSGFINGIYYLSYESGQYAERYKIAISN